MKGRAAIEHFYKQGTDASHTVGVTSLTSQASGALGYQNGLAAATFKGAKGKSVKVSGKYVSIFVQENGAWKVKYLGWNTNPQRAQ